uniref:Uncharacterized protein n=1 Tax=viral metagenome TaxID=1070528 RepID=A0A6C0DIV2_9ZZZZ
MDRTVSSMITKIPIVQILWISLMVLVVYTVINIGSNYLSVSKLRELEGFDGAVRGTGHPDCLRTLDKAAEVLGLVDRASSSPDFAEFQLILSKLACFKKDVMSPSGIIMATRYQPYETAHDREPIAEVAATCIKQTIPQRDLDIIFKTYLNRGNVLLKRLCTTANLTEEVVCQAEQLFSDAWTDVYSVAQQRCIATPADTYNGVLRTTPFEPQEVKELGEYNGYFSGWSGGNV